MVPGTELLYRCHPFRVWESRSVAIPNFGPNVHEMNAFISLSCIHSICRAVVFEVWMAEDPPMKDPMVPHSTKRVLASKEASG